METILSVIIDVEDFILNSNMNYIDKKYFLKLMGFYSFYKDEIDKECISNFFNVFLPGAYQLRFVHDIGRTLTPNGKVVLNFNNIEDKTEWLLKY